MQTFEEFKEANHLIIDYWKFKGESDEDTEEYMRDCYNLYLIGQSKDLKTGVNNDD